MTGGDGDILRVLIISNQKPQKYWIYKDISNLKKQNKKERQICKNKMCTQNIEYM